MKLPEPKEWLGHYKLVALSVEPLLRIYFDRVGDWRSSIDHCYYETTIERLKFRQFWKFPLPLDMQLWQSELTKKLRFVGSNGFTIDVGRGSYEVSSFKLTPPSYDEAKFEVALRDFIWYRRAKILIKDPSKMSSAALDAGAEGEWICSDDDSAWEVFAEFPIAEMLKSASLANKPALPLEVVKEQETLNRQMTEQCEVIEERPGPTADEIAFQRIMLAIAWVNEDQRKQLARQHAAMYGPDVNYRPMPVYRQNVEQSASQKVLNSRLKIVPPVQCAEEDDVPF